MREAFKQCYPVEHDLPPAMRAALARIAELEAAAAGDRPVPAKIPAGWHANFRDRQFA